MLKKSDPQLHTATCKWRGSSVRLCCKRAKQRSVAMRRLLQHKECNINVLIIQLLDDTGLAHIMTRSHTLIYILLIFYLV